MTILLFSLPWLEPNQAPLGLSVVSRTLRGGGLDVEVRYPNLNFWLLLHQRLGADAARAAFLAAEVGEVAAAILLRRQSDPLALDHPALLTFLEQRAYPRALFEGVVRLFEDFTNHTLDQIDFGPVRACGFTLTLHQTAASLYWAQQIKQRAPNVAIVFGGNQCADPMGLELFRTTPWIDYMARGEADSSILPLFRAIVSGTAGALDTIPNLVYRAASKTVVTESQSIDMAATVAPDYTDFSAAYQSIEAHLGVPANYYIEASRGCWWGQKHHCMFCGIHTDGIGFREKPAGTVLAEIERVLADTRAFQVVFADTILSVHHIRSLLPQLERRADATSFTFLADVKPNLRKQEVYALARAGAVVLQAGIESLSDRLLRLLVKGNTALQQIRFLKWCTEAGIFPYYHILTHVKDETPADYAEVLAFMQRLIHLPPPSGVFPIELNRYAPYYEAWRELGFDPPRPATAYRLMFGTSAIDLDTFAYRFEGVHPSTRSTELDAARAAVSRFVEEEWKPRYHEETLTYQVGDGFLRVTRQGRQQHTRLLEGPEARLYLLCDDIQHAGRLSERLDGALPDAEIRRLLNELCDDGFMVQARDGDHYLATALRRLRLRPTLPPEYASAAALPPEREVIDVLPRGR